MERLRKARTDLALLPVLALAAGLRLYNLPARGLIYWDEAKFALEGVRVLAALQLLAGAKVAPNAGKAVGSAKPVHALLISLSYALLGVHDWAPLLLNALASTLAVAFTYLVARQLFSPTVGLVAALLLAVSQYDVLYARSALSESDSVLFFLAGAWAWLRGRDRGLRWTVLAGLLMGIGFTANYRLIVYIGVLVALDLLRRWRELGPTSLPRSLGAWATGLLIAPLLCQAAGLLAAGHGVTLYRSDITASPTSYLREVLYQLHGGKQAFLRFDPGLYTGWYLVRVGPVASLLLLIGLVLAVRRRTLPWLAPAVLVIVPFAAYCAAPFIVPRNLVALLPFAAILAAAALREVLRAHRQVALGALVLALAWGFAGCLPLTGMRSGFAQAAAYLHGRGALTSTEDMVFYLRGPSGTCRAPAIPLTLRGLSAALRGGYRYAVQEDYHTSAITAYIKTHGRLVAAFPTYGSIPLLDDPISAENGLPPGRSLPERVELYWIGGFPLHAGAGAMPYIACRQDNIT